MSLLQLKKGARAGLTTLTPRRLVKNPLSLSLQDLKAKFEVVTLPVTLVCAGSEFSAVALSPLSSL